MQLITGCTAPKGPLEYTPPPKPPAQFPETTALTSRPVLVWPAESINTPPPHPFVDATLFPVIQQLDTIPDCWMWMPPPPTPMSRLVTALPRITQSRTRPLWPE